jgi:hypothetical protein
VELRGDFPRVGRQEPSRSWRKVCYLLRADARVHSGKLSQVTDDQADRGEAQDYCGEGMRGERGRAILCIYSITRLGPNVNNDLASRLKRIEWECLLNRILNMHPGKQNIPDNP